MNQENKPASEKKYEVTSEGSLGLLALGYRGVIEWKKKVKEQKTKEPKKENE